MRGKRKACVNIFKLQFREVTQHFFAAHSSSEVFEDVTDSDPHPANAGLAASLSGFYRNSVLIIHSCIIADFGTFGKCVFGELSPFFCLVKQSRLML